MKKFRAWHKKQKRYIDLNGFDINFNSCNNVGAIYKVYEQGNLASYDIADVEIEQFTGLQDNSTLLTELYHGDLLKCYQGYTHEIIWSDGGFNVICNDIGGAEPLTQKLIDANYMVKIGNIHSED